MRGKAGKALSEDLKWRIIYLYRDGYSTMQITNLLYLSKSMINKTILTFNKWGCVSNPLKSKQGRRKIFGRHDLNILKELIRKRKDWFLDELVIEMETNSGKRVAIPTLWRALKYLGITRKKIEKAAKERNEILRSAFLVKIFNEYLPEQFIFLDETSKDERSLSRLYGYSFRNQPAVQSVVFLRGTRYTILPALSLDGIIGIEIIEGSCNKQLFQEFIISQVIPQMLPFPQKNSVLVMDNARIHHNEKIISIVEEFGGRVLFLPPYSPDFNPIELAFSVIKSWLRKYNEFVSSFDNPKYPLMLACAQITSEMAKSFYSKSIYL